MKSTIEPVVDTPEDAPAKKLVKLSVDGRRGRVRSRHRQGVPDDRPRGPAARVPPGQGAAQGARGPHRPGPAREQALRDAVPQYLAKAVREHDVDLIATPEIEITGGAGTGPVAFDATCEVRPEITVPGYGGLRVELPSLEATEADDRRGGRGRAAPPRHARRRRPPGRSPATTSRSTSPRTRDGEPVAGLNTEDWLVRGRQGLGRRRLRRAS